MALRVIKATSPLVLFRCDASPTTGLGHWIRSRALANALIETGGSSIAFAMRESLPDASLPEEEKVPIYTPAAGSPAVSQSWLLELVDRLEAGVLVLDTSETVPLEVLAQLREQGILIVVVDSLGPARLLADLAIYPPVPQVKEADWQGFDGKLLWGWDWVILRGEFCVEPMPFKTPIRPRVLLAMGGSDPFGLSRLACDGLSSSALDFELDILVGPAGANWPPQHQPGGNKRIRIHRNPPDVRGLMAKASLAVASFGVTAYELAATGVPAIYLCLTGDHAQSAQVFEEAGIGDCLGIYKEVSSNQLKVSVETRLSDDAGLQEVRRRARGLVDGCGAARVAEEIYKQLARRAQMAGRP